VLVEFVSANPTGPLHMASGRAATLGDALVRILRKLGYDAKSEYYVNDAGRQVLLLGQSLHARYHGQEPPEGGYLGDYITTTARGAPPEAAQWNPERFSAFGIEDNLAKHRKDLEDFRVSFDRWFRESELHQAGELEEALKALRGKGKIVEKEGAVWFASAEDEDDKDRVLVRSDGRPTYFLADIAYHFDKLKRADRLVDVWGADHHGYVPRMKAAVETLGGPGAFHPVVHQLVHLYRGSEKVKMSKRAGEFITLRELVEEVGVDACRFFFAMRGPHTHLNFDLELAKKKSQENPVYYVQYVHARIRSIAAEAAKRGVPEGPPPAGALEGLGAPEERALLVKLAWFPAALELCAREDSPHHLATYLTELAGLFHPFYERCRVADPAEPLRSQARLALCEGVRLVIRDGLDLLGIEAPERM
jgi:arginyl-tRNA synthetase